MHKSIRFLLKNVYGTICGRYDVNENKLILSVTMDANGKVDKEIL